VFLLLINSSCFAQASLQNQQTEGESVCPMVESAARANALPVGFFARLIWQESRFHPDAVGPETRSGEHALGIAQFMPGTAIEQELFEPFDPKQALPKSGAFLAQLRDEFGNLGLAAAGYNAGPQRVRDFLAGLRGLPEETRNYVLIVTGRPIEDWVKKGSEPFELNELSRIDALPTDCRQLMASLDSAASSSGHVLQRDLRNVPSWCAGLSHPNIKICGSVHAPENPLRAAVSQLRKKLRPTKASL
jgi:hypothetical protein